MVKRHDASIKWGASAIKFGGHELVGYIEKYKGHIKTILDFGCGKGVLEEWVNDRLRCPKPVWTKYDPGIPGLDTLPDGPFDMVMTCDVLEHVEPHLIDATIAELEKRTRIVMYNNIACAPCNGTFTTGPYIGENIHINVQTPEWWKAKFAERGRLVLYEYKALSRRARREYRARCTLVHEKIR